MTTFKESVKTDGAPAPRVSRLDGYFKLTERGSTLGREFRGGLATFFAMVYIVILNPLILSGPDGSGQTLGIPQVAAATAIVAGVMTILMGLVARYPFALSAGLGVSGFVSATIATTPGLTWPDIMGLIVVSGVVMFVLVLCGFREAVFKAVPSGLKIAIVVGIGLFITIIGFVNAGFVRRIPDDAHTTVPVNLGVGGVLVGWPTLVFVVGLVLLIILMVRKVRGGILIGILATTAFAVVLQLFTKTPAGSAENPTGWSLVVPDLPTEFISFPDLSLFGKMDVFGAFAHIGVISASLLTFTILLSVFFDAMGTMTGLASEANLLDKDNNFVDANPVLLVDAAASAVGGFASVSANEIFVESAAGVGEGARTGIASIVTGALFIITAFFAPLSNIVPFEAVAPALVMVGFLMTTQVRNIDWADWGIAIPAFLTFALMPLTYSIANGLGAGFIAFVIIRAVQGRAKDVHPLMWLVSVAFVAFFMVGLFEQVLGV